MNKLILFLSTLLVLLSCSSKTNVKEDVENNTEKIEEKIENAEVEQPKSKYEIRKALEKKFKRLNRGQYVQIIPLYMSNKNENGIYCHFLEKGNRYISLNLHIQYDDYNADYYELSVGETMKKYESNKSLKIDKSEVVVNDATFKWFDKMINEEDEALIRKIGEQKTGTLKLFRSTGELIATKQLTKEESQSLLNTIDYYKALNGSKIPKKGMVNIRSFQ